MNDQKTIQQWTDRELQEQVVKLLYQQEQHLKYFSTVITIYIVLTFVGLCGFIVMLSK